MESRGQVSGAGRPGVSPRRWQWTLSATLKGRVPLRGKGTGAEVKGDFNQMGSAGSRVHWRGSTFNLKCRLETLGLGVGRGVSDGPLPPSWFLRSGLRGERPLRSACPVLPAPSAPGARRRLRHRSGGGPAGPGGGARGGQHRGQLPPQCAAAVGRQRLNPFPAGARQATRSRRAVLPAGGRGPGSVNSFPPKTQGRGGHPPQCTAAGLDSMGRFNPLPQGGSKAEGIGGHRVPVKEERRDYKERNQ